MLIGIYVLSKTDFKTLFLCLLKQPRGFRWGLDLQPLSLTPSSKRKILFPSEPLWFFIITRKYLVNIFLFGKFLWFTSSLSYIFCFFIQLFGHRLLHFSYFICCCNSVYREILHLISFLFRPSQITLLFLSRYSFYFWLAITVRQIQIRHCANINKLFIKIFSHRVPWLFSNFRSYRTVNKATNFPYYTNC